MILSPSPLEPEIAALRAAFPMEPAMPRVTDLCRNVLMTGKNLAVVLRYARKSPVNVIRIDVSVEHREKYAVTFYFDDHAECLTYWGDWRVLLDWLIARRSWSFHRVRFADRALFDAAWSYPATLHLRKRQVEIAGPPPLPAH